MGRRLRRLRRGTLTEGKQQVKHTHQYIYYIYIYYVYTCTVNHMFY